MRLLAETGTPSAIGPLARALSDDDLRIAATAVWRLSAYPGELPDLYDPLEALLERMPKKAVELEPMGWTGPLPALKRENVAALMLNHADPPQVDRVLPHAKALDPWSRGRLVDLLAKERSTDARREALLAFLADASPEVRGRAIAAASRLKLSDAEALALEPLLRRKPGDLRRGVLELIAGRGDAWALGAAGRLLEGDEQQRLGAVDLLRRLAGESSPYAAKARERLAQLGAGEDEATVAVAAATRRAVRDDPLGRLNESDGFGLFDERDLTPAVAPRRTGFTAKTPAALRTIALLDELIDRHADVEIVLERWGGPERVLLGAADTLGLAGHAASLRRGDTELELPLGELWSDFARDLPADARDPDGQQLLRAHLHCMQTAARFSWGESAKVATALGTRYTPLVTDVLGYLAFCDPDADRLACALDAAEESLAQLSRRQLAAREGWSATTFELEIVRALVALPFADDCPALTRRHWQLERWNAEPPGATPALSEWQRERPRASKRVPLRPPIDLLALALARGAATEADLVDHLVGPRSPYWEHHALGRLSTPRGRRQLPAAEQLGAVVERIRERVVAVELTRGEAPTPAASAVLALRRTGGLDVLAAALAALGSESLVRGWSRDGEGRAPVFSHLIACSVPDEADTPERFRAALGGVGERRVREIACYAPQWARHIEAALQRPGLADAVWWLHAHTKDSHWTADEDLREDWARAVAERTALTSQELEEGAVDVAWFGAVRERLGDAELDLLLKPRSTARPPAGTSAPSSLPARCAATRPRRSSSRGSQRAAIRTPCARSACCRCPAARSATRRSRAATSTCRPIAARAGVSAASARPARGARPRSRWRTSRARRASRIPCG